MILKKAGGAILRFYLSLRLIVTLFTCIGIAAFGIWAGFFLDHTLDETLLLRGDLTTRLFADNGNGEMVELVSDRISGHENALYAPIDEISPHLINAFIAIEDKRFYEHGGVDWYRTFSAVIGYMRGNGEFGGSTITQQLVKNLTGENEKSVRRKIAELLRAIELEKRLEKDEILELYLNVVNLSQNCYGVKTAANAYFSKEPCDLDVGEAALIAAITNNPSRYDPIRHPKENEQRRNVILSQMYAQEMIDKECYLKYSESSTPLHVQKEVLSGRVNSWYADMVVKDVIEALMLQKGMSRAAASRLVYGAGLKIYTAMSLPLQQIVSDYYEDPDNFPTHTDGKKAQSSLMLLDPASGRILAVAGAIGEKRSNRVQSFATDTKRPSGSVIKPLSVYAPALSEGLIHYGTVFDDVPLSFKENGAPWPRNAPNIYRGLTTVNEGVKQSVNTVSIRVLERLGYARSYRFLKEKLKFHSLSEKNDLGAASLALGQQHEGVTLREILGGYTPLANDGVFTGAQSFYLVLDREDRVLLENAMPSERVLERADAAILTQMLRGAVQEGTGSALQLKQKVDVAGKTGTTGKNCDKWFVGYTPELLCGVWYGYEYPAPLNDVSGNPSLRIFDEVMHRVVDKCGVQKRQFNTPDDVVILRYCKDSGKLPTSACSLDARGNRIEYGYFKKGTEPREYCDCHVCISYCEGGGVATSKCPEAQQRTVALLRVYREFPRQIAVLDAPYTYAGELRDGMREISYYEPYYAHIHGFGKNYGIKMGQVPYNHACPVHPLDEFWHRRKSSA